MYTLIDKVRLFNLRFFYFIRKVDRTIALRRFDCNLKIQKTQFFY